MKYSLIYRIHEFTIGSEITRKLSIAGWPGIYSILTIEKMTCNHLFLECFNLNEDVKRIWT